ncbi:MAG: T9SS type A sorting domain-containing protein [Ichthyobacteriaceae bacterium]|nr:T9SS type A sorting domain-containing protein [Ichthyobacteriaceae bacterium]
MEISDLEPGVYILKLEINGNIEVHKIVK